MSLLSNLDPLKRFSDGYNSKTKLTILTSAVGVILFVVIATMLPFKDQLFSYLYPKPKSQAQEESQQNQQKPKFSGFLVEFKDDSVMEHKRKTQSPEKIDRQPLLDYEKNILLPNHDKAKNDVLSKVAAVKPQQAKVVREYTKVFNGIALDIDESLVNEIKKSPFVKDVYPNLEVKTNLNESVPLIGADKVWQLKDNQGKNITGEGINIAVIDTGVDYTHPDLGASQIPERNFQKIISDSGSHLAVSSDRSKFAFDKYYIENDIYISKIYVYSSTGQKLNEFLLPDNEKWVAQIVIEGNYLAFFGWGNYGENAGVSLYDLTTGEHRRVDNNNVVGTMHIYENTLYYGTGQDSWSEPDPSFNIEYVSFTSYNILTENKIGVSPYVSPTNYYTINGAFDKNRVAFPVPEKDGDQCAKNIYIFDLTLSTQGLSFSPPEVGLVIDFKGDEVLYIACNAANFDPTGSSYYLFNIKTGSATKLTYLPDSNLTGISGAGMYNGLLTKIPDMSPQTSTFNWNRYNLGLIGDSVVYFKRNFGSNKIIIYNKSQQKYYRLNIVLPIGRFISRGDSICFNNINNYGISCHDYDPNYDYPIPTEVFNNKVVSGYNFILPDEFSLDDHGHGTHVAATAASNGIPKGVAPVAKLIAYKVLDSFGSGSFSTVIAGIEKAVSTLFDSDSNNDIQVISMSLGATCWGGYTANCGPYDILSKSVDNAVDAGITAVIAAGNSGPIASTIGTPGTARQAITVGAVDKSKQLASFSSRGPVVYNGETINKPDVVAPGVSICAAEWDSWHSDSRCIDDKHIAISGTSMATPHVAGLAALIKQINPGMTPAEIKNAIMTYAVDLGLDSNWQGAGLIDAYSSVDNSKPFGLSISPSSVNATDTAGSIVKVLNLTSTGANIFQFYGYPTSNLSITWYPQSGGIIPGSTIPISVQILNSVPAGTYQGTGTLMNLQGQQMSIPVTINVVTPSPTPTPDTILPSVNITNPVNGSTVGKNSTVNITASASDNVGMNEVQFYVDGTLKCTDNRAPYSCSWSVPKSPRVTYSIVAKAYDTSNNSASSTINVTSK